jgi:hypothetical protein
MALAAYTDVETSWAKKTLETAAQTEMTACIAHAQSWIAHQAGLRSLEKEAAAVTEYVDGSKIDNPYEIYLSAACRPAWHTGTGSDLMTVVESGVTLTPAIGYSTTAGVILSGVNSFERVRLSRVGGWVWSRGLTDNIAVTLKCGFDSSTTAGTNPLPFDVKRLVTEVAWLVYNSSSWVGKSSISKAGTSVSIADELSPAGQSTLDWLRGI